MGMTTSVALSSASAEHTLASVGGERITVCFGRDLLITVPRDSLTELLVGLERVVDVLKGELYRVQRNTVTNNDYGDVA